MKISASAVLALLASQAAAFAPVNTFGVRSSDAALDAKKSIADLSDDEIKGKKILIR